MAEVYRPQADEPRPPSSGPRPEDPLGELLRTATDDLATLFRSEIELAKLEMKEDVREAGKLGGIFGAGAICAYFALLLASFAVVWLLEEVMHIALAFLIVAVVYGIAAAVLFVRGRSRATNFNPAPEQTIQTLKEDVQWAKQRTN